MDGEQFTAAMADRHIMMFNRLRLLARGIHVAGLWLVSFMVYCRRPVPQSMQRDIKFYNNNQKEEPVNDLAGLSNRRPSLGSYLAGILTC